MVKNKTVRTESLPNSSGDTFKVGEGVHWGFNGDRYPGTVRKVSASGRRVWVSEDDYRATEKEMAFVKEHGRHEGDIDCVFTPKDVSESKWTMYKLNKFGRFMPNGARARSGWSLQSGRCFAQNPSF